MAITKHYSTKLLVIGLVLINTSICAQQGIITIEKPTKLDSLMVFKREMNLSNNNSDRYKIQIYSGDRSGATTALKRFKELFTNWNAVDVYEPPNYKVWVGNFRSRLEVDRALLNIQREFQDAFRFKPKKKDIIK